MLKRSTREKWPYFITTGAPALTTDANLYRLTAPQILLMTAFFSYQSDVVQRVKRSLMGLDSIYSHAELYNKDLTSFPLRFFMVAAVR